MPIAFADGFDRYSNTIGSLSPLAVWSGNYSSLVAGRFGNSAIRLQTFSDLQIFRRIFQASDKVGVQFAFRCENILSMNNLAKLLRMQNTDSENLVIMDTTADGEFRILDGLGAVVYTSPQMTFTTNVWIYLELHVEFHASTGLIRFKVNGEELYEGTGLNTVGANLPATCDRIRFDFAATSGNVGANAYQLDDLMVIIDESDTLGEVRIQTISVNTDIVSDFVPLSGTDNWAMVDEIQADGDTTYNSSATATSLDVFGLEDLGSVPDTIFGIYMSIAARKDDGGTRQLTTLFRIGGTDYDLSTQFLTTDYVFKDDVAELNPATGVAWTLSDINALQIGYRLDE